jgi:hypothetical protein
MKRYAITILLSLSVVAYAADKDVANYPLTAHVIGSIAGRGHGGSLTARTCTYELRVGDMTYITQQRSLHCDAEVSAGDDFSVQIQKKKLTLLKKNGKEMTLDVIGTSE